MLKNYLFLLCLGLSCQVWGQQKIKNLTFKEFSDPILCLNESGDTLKLPWLGGLTSPQFSNFDFNNDGKQDLLILDKINNMMFPLIYSGTPENYTYKWVPSYVKHFPEGISHFVMSRDYNKDGKMDLIYHTGSTGVISAENVTSPQDTLMQFVALNEEIPYEYKNLSQVMKGFNMEIGKGSIPHFSDMDGDGDIDVLSYTGGFFGITYFKNTSLEKNLGLDTLTFDRVDMCWGDFREKGLVNDVFYERGIYCETPWNREFKKKHSGGSTVLALDMDEDGDLDLILGNAGFHNLILLYNGKSDFGTAQDTMIASDTLFPSNTKPAIVNTYPAPHYVDYNGDGENDLIVTVNIDLKCGNCYFKEKDAILHYKNVGTTEKPKFEYDTEAWFVDEILDFGGRAAPALWDYDKDGDLDIVVAGNGDLVVDKDGNDRLHLIENIGDKNTPKFQLKDNDFLNIYGLRVNSLRPVFADMDNDGKDDMLMGVGNGFVWLFKNTGTLQNPIMTLIDKSYGGVSVDTLATPYVIDLDNDGFKDLVVGNATGIFKYYKGLSKLGTFKLVDDSLGNVFTNSIDYKPVVPRYDFYGFSSPAIVNNEKGRVVMLSGNLRGELRKFEGKANALDQTFTKDSTFLFDRKTDVYNQGAFGGVSHLALGDLNNDSIPDLVVGNNRGGISIFKGSADADVDHINRKNKTVNWKLYPNPAHQSLHLVFEQPFGDMAQYQLIDITGKICVKGHLPQGEKKHKISTQTLAPGTYFLQVSTAGFETLCKRIVIMH